jgi:hypothetical protein
VALECLLLRGGATTALCPSFFRLLAPKELDGSIGLAVLCPLLPHLDQLVTRPVPRAMETTELRAFGSCWRRLRFCSPRRRVILASPIEEAAVQYDDQIEAAFQSADDQMRDLIKSGRVNDIEAVAIMLSGMARAMQDAFLLISRQIGSLAADSQT